MHRVPLDQLSYATFAALTHSTFKVHGSGAVPVQIKLLEATASPAESALAAPQNFSLIFVGPADSFLPQRTYLLEHEKIGQFDLFIVPIGKDQSGFRYQAIFNRYPSGSAGAESPG